MGKALSEASTAARELFQEVDDALQQNLFRIMCEGPEADLTLTENAQPAIMANAIATLRVLEKEGGLRLADKGDFVAGHSLGEYTALCAAEAFDVATTARLLKLRGQAMQAAVPVGEGAMAALLGADIEKAQALANAAAEGEVCSVANDNDPSQVVISGHRGAIERAVAMVKDYGIKRGVLLPVSAPFHCSLMQPAADAMAEALAKATIKAPLLPVYANVLAAPIASPMKSASGWWNRSRAVSAGANPSVRCGKQASPNLSSWAPRCSAHGQADCARRHRHQRDDDGRYRSDAGRCAGISRHPELVSGSTNWNPHHGC